MTTGSPSPGTRIEVRTGKGTKKEPYTWAYATVEKITPTRLMFRLFGDPADIPPGRCRLDQQDKTWRLLKCNLCHGAEPDYRTAVFLRYFSQQAGWIVVDVHMRCLLETGGTTWQIADRPELSQSQIERARSTDKAEGQHALLSQARQDLQLFRADFADLVAERDRLFKIAETAHRERAIVWWDEVQGAMWWGIERPVDMLLALRAIYDKLTEVAPHLQMLQGKLL